MNPYEILDIPAEADQDAIKAAYRELCKQHHPDVGGDPDKFIEIQKAYEVLTDSAMRRMFDDLGVMPGTPEFQLISDAMQHIANMFSTLIRAMEIEAFVRENILDTLRAANLKEQMNHQQAVNDLDRTKARILRAKQIIQKQVKKKKANSPNLFLRVLDDKIKEVDQALLPEKHAVEVMKKTRELLDEYEFMPDFEGNMQMMLVNAAQQAPMGNVGGLGGSPFWRG